MKTFRYWLVECVVLVIAGLAFGWTPQVWEDYVANRSASNLPDFSWAGYEYGQKEIPQQSATVNVADFGAIPNDNLDDTSAIQAAIDYLSQSDGGVLYIPSGRYDINTDSSSNYLKINSYNIVVRGAGSGTDGTVLFLNNCLNGDAATITAGDNMDPSSFGRFVTYLKEDAVRGSNILKVASTEKLAAGDYLHITMKNTDGLTNLTEYLISPLQIDSTWTNAANSGVGYTYFRWIVEVAEVLDEHHIKLVQPIRENLKVEFDTEIYRTIHLFNIGVENIRFESNWTEAYSHLADDANSYWWNGIFFKNVINGWVKNVQISDYTQSLGLRFCKNISVENVELLGRAGHIGFLVGAYDCKITDSVVNCPRTHAMTVNQYSQGNVFRNVTIGYNGSDHEDCFQVIDFHCNYALENLFENITNAAVRSSGDRDNYPHSSHRNVFWNIQVGDALDVYDSWDVSEFFADVTYRNRSDDHKLHPGSIVAGVYNSAGDLKIDQDTADRSDEWITVEGLNQQGIEPASLYSAQLALRGSCSEYSVSDLNKDCFVDLADFGEFAEKWQDCTDPGDMECGGYWNDPSDPNYPSGINW